MSNETKDETVAAAENPVEESKVEEAVESEIDWKREARKWEQRAHQNKEAAKRGEDAVKRLAEIEDAEKSEVQRLQEQVEALTAERDNAVLASNRAALAAEFGLSMEDAEMYLDGTDADAMRKRAERLAELNKPRVPEAPNQGRSGGGNSTAAAQSWAESLMRKN